MNVVTTRKNLRSIIVHIRAGTVTGLGFLYGLCPPAMAEVIISPRMETSAAYEAAAAPLRQAPEKNYDFNRASVRDVLRFLADDAEIDFVALPEDGDDHTKLITFSLNKSPFSALEIISRMNGVALIFEDKVWHMRPLNDTALIARAYRVRFNTAELKGSGKSSSSSSSFGATGGGLGGATGGGIGGLGLGGTTGVFSTSADELVEAVKSIVDIRTSGMNAVIAPGINTVGNFGPLQTGTGADTLFAAQVITAKNSSGATSGGGQVLWNSDTNSLFIVATRQQHQLVEKYLETIDQPQPLIAVEIKFFETTKDPRKQMGVDWSGTMDGGYGLSLSGMTTNLDLSRLGDTQLPMTAILSAPDVQAKVLALIKDRQTTTVSYPRVLTRNNREVAIQSVVNQPVLSAQSSTTPGVGGTTTSSISYLPIGTSINVLPKCLENGRISLQVLITVSSIIGSEIIGGNSYPVASSRVFTAPLEVESGYTLAIAGLDEAFDSREGTGLPLLSKIPILKHGFKRDTKSHTRKNMLIFITPTILDARSGGISKTPISEIPLRGNAPRAKLPRVRPDGSLAGGIDSLENALAWLQQEFTLIDQIVREKRGVREHGERLDQLINTVNMLWAQLNTYKQENPSKLKDLEDKELSLEQLHSRMQTIRQELYRGNYQLFSRPLTQVLR
ncbi:MAG: secretin N-terminal domain-containing protein [Verrucomicrobiales bacterium]